LTDDYCDGSCECHWYWPSASTWEDSNAACRCKSVSAEDESTVDDIDTIESWDFGGACASQSDDFCDGSCECNWSWPSTGSWDDPDAACRCQSGSSDSTDSNDTTDNTDASDSTDTTDSTDSGSNNTPISVTDILAGFEAIHNNPHYSDTEFSRTLYQVDQTLDFIEEKLIEMAGGLANIGGNTETSEKTDDDGTDDDSTDDSNTDGENTDGGDITSCDDVMH
jgi:hypothetical protein